MSEFTQCNDLLSGALLRYAELCPALLRQAHHRYLQEVSPTRRGQHAAVSGCAMQSVASQSMANRRYLQKFPGEKGVGVAEHSRRSAARCLALRTKGICKRDRRGGFPGEKGAGVAGHSRRDAVQGRAMLRQVRPSKANQRYLQKKERRMALKKLLVEIRGGAPHGSPLLTHAYRGEKPTEVKPRTKTQEWLDEQRKKMWFEALYHDGTGVYIPSENLERMLVNGARKFRKGESFKEGVYVDGNINRLALHASDSLQAPGKEALGPPERWWVPEHQDLRGVVNKTTKGRLDCCRPIFRLWSVKFTIVYESSIVTREEIEQAMTRNSIGAYRPRFGRFIVTELTPIGG